MKLLQDLATRAMTVQVAGEDVHLRPPDLSIQLDVKQFLAAEKEEQGLEYLKLTAKALHATVVVDEEGPQSVEDWERVIQTPDDLAPEGLKDLVDAALKLCGMKVELPEGAKDHAAEVDDALGNSGTK